jgi:hypothetical protein
VAALAHSFTHTCAFYFDREASDSIAHKEAIEKADEVALKEAICKANTQAQQKAVDETYTTSLKEAVVKADEKTHVKAQPRHISADSHGCRVWCVAEWLEWV